MAGAGDFQQVLSKFRWAQHQLAALDLAVSDYIAQEPYVAVVEDQPHAQAYRVTAHLRYPPPASIAHIVTDVAGSLHGTLDYLAWQLAVREGLGQPDEATFFPILTDPPDEGATKARVNIFRRKAPGESGEQPLIADPAVLDILRAVQPYNLPEAERTLHSLQVLRVVNRESKHRHPAVLVTTVKEGHWAHATDRIHGVEVPPGVNLVMETLNFTPRYDGDELAWLSYGSVSDRGLPQDVALPTVVALESSGLRTNGEALSVVELFTFISGWIRELVLEPFAQLDW